MNVQPLKLRKPSRFLFIMDAYETLNLQTETSLLLMEELQSRGVAVYWAEQKDLILLKDQLYIMAKPLVSGSPFELGDQNEIEAGEFDAIVVRPDPPVDENYLHLTYLLDFVPPNVKQFNRPDALRNLNEKLLPLRWPHLVPPTLTTQNEEALEAFLNVHKDIVIKPLGDCSGRGITRVESGDDAAIDLIRQATRAPSGKARRFVTAQAFLPKVRDGDKRVFIAGGQVVGIVNRVPAPGGYLGNIHQGATCEAAELTAAEAAAIEEITPYLLEKGVFLVGADFIGGKLTELNITSPSAIRQINEVSQADIHPLVVDMMLAALKQSQEIGFSVIGKPSLGRGVGNN